MKSKALFWYQAFQTRDPNLYNIPEMAPIYKISLKGEKRERNTITCYDKYKQSKKMSK